MNRTPKLITLEAKDSSGGLSSSEIVLKFLSLESVVLAGKSNAVDGALGNRPISDFGFAGSINVSIGFQKSVPINRLSLPCFDLI